MKSRRSDFGSSVIIVAAVFTVLLTLALASTTWAAPGLQGTIRTATPTATETFGPPCPPGGCPGPTETPHFCGDPGECISSSKSISVPVGVILPGGKLVLNEVNTQPPCPATPDGQIFLDHCFKVDWLNPDGTFMTTLSQPVLDCLTYSDSDLAAAGGNPANLLIGFVFKDPNAKWTLVKPIVDAAHSRVCANPAEPFYWQALFTPKPTLPVTGMDERSYYWVVLVILLVGLWAGLIWRARSPARR